MVVHSNPVAVTYTSNIAPVSSMEFLNIQATVECKFTLKCARGMIRTYCKNILTTQLNHLASLSKWLSVHLRTIWLWVQILLQSL